MTAALGGEPEERPRPRPGVVGALTEDAEPAAFDDVQRVLPVLTDKVVFAVADEREVVGREPLQERSSLGHLVLRERRRVGVEHDGELETAVAHRPSVRDGSTDIGEHAHDVVLQPGELMRLGAAVDLEVEEGLHRQPARPAAWRAAVGRRGDSGQDAGAVALHGDTRVDDE